jgi:hypothetical protein
MVLRDLPASIQSQTGIAIANIANQCYIISVEKFERIKWTQAKKRGEIFVGQRPEKSF